MSVVELTMPKDTFRALAKFVSPRTGGQDTNTNAAIHIRRRSDVSISVAVSNGRTIMLAHLFRDSDALTNFFFSDDEYERTVSIVPTRELLGALGSMGKVVTLAISDIFCKVKTSGETGITEHVVPRLCGRQIALFDDLEQLPQYTINDLAAAGQRTVDPDVLKKIAEAGKLLKMSGQITVASIRDRDGGLVYGFQVGSDNTAWWFMRADVQVPSALAGLPPDWVGSTGGGRPITAMLDQAQETEARYAVQEQGALPYDTGEGEDGDEDAAEPQDAAEQPEDDEFALPEIPEISAPDTSPAFTFRLITGETCTWTLERIATYEKLGEMLQMMSQENLLALRMVAEEKGFDSIAEAVEAELRRKRDEVTA
jgi:hypothetical protein